MISAVGNPRVVINGTCLDFLGESFMEGVPHKNGGFMILNGVKIDIKGQIFDLPEPYTGSNLFSLPSGGALYIRGPHHQIDRGQLNGAQFVNFSSRDWGLTEPYLEKNQLYFVIPIVRLLEVDGIYHQPSKIYRKIVPIKDGLLQAEEAWVGHRE